MLQAHARHMGAFIVGVALALPLAAMAQSKAPEAAPTKAAPASPAAPQADAPKVASPPPTPAKGSTAVPGWNNPPDSWDSASERPQYASIPGRETNRLIQGNGREWRAFRNGPLTHYAGWFFVLVLAALTLFYLVRGPLRLHGQDCRTEQLASGPCC